MWILIFGIAVFLAAGGALYYSFQPITLRIAVGPAGSEDRKVVEAMAQAFASESRTIRLSAIPTEGAAQAIALLGSGKADLAVGRGDLEMPADTQTLAVLRKNYAVLWSVTAIKGSRKKSTGKINEIADLEGHKVGVIGRTAANVALLNVILGDSGVQLDKVEVVQFGVDQLEELARNPTLDAFLAVGPLDSKITADAISITSRSRGAPKFIPLDASEAIALKHPRYDAEEIPAGVFNARPAWPEDKVDTISVSHLIVARKTLSEAKAATFFRELFAIREVIAQQVPGAAHITKPDTEKNAELPVHRGAAAVINGTERTFLDKYGDYFWFALLILSAIGSATAWLRRYLNRDERIAITKHRDRILKAASEVRTAQSKQRLLAVQREVDTVISETLDCYDDGAIEEEDLAAFGLALNLYNHAILERCSSMQIGTLDLSSGPVEDIRFGVGR